MTSSFLSRILYRFIVISIVLMAGCDKADETKETDPTVNGGLDSGTPDSGVNDAGTPSEDTDVNPGYLLVDDFEDGDNTALLGGSWYHYDDADNGGLSFMEISESGEGAIVMDGEGYESERSLHFGFTLDQGEWEYDPYLGWGVTMGNEDSPYDMSRFDALAYYFKGSAHVARVDITAVEDHDEFFVTVPASSTWTLVEVPFAYLRQEGWGEQVDFDPAGVRNLSWQISGSTGDTGEFWMDDLMLRVASGEGERGEPDMTIRESSPPAENTLESYDVPNPLQAIALQSLNRGYNITNWLEAGKFEEFGEYDEQFVSSLAANGFKALRLPIDMDQYIEDREAYFNGEVALAIEPMLFTILDAFEGWTATHGLSLTIDYHQYDQNFDMQNPLYVEAVIALWSAVSEHFADNPRIDLFFELMNEIEQAGGTDELNADDWTAFAQQIIASIRQHDTDRTILFGDVAWNGIDPLTRRTPFDDPQMIYVFHFYDPFIFTHQGASWTDLSHASGIPYPYDANRWAEYYIDLGLIPTQTPDWILSNVRNYYRDGNRAALWNQVLKAKAFSVQHNVPVVCNEFGAYTGTSQIEDRLNYYRDVTGIFEELEIPWQHWFGTMDPATGEVDPNLKAAMGMD